MDTIRFRLLFILVEFLGSIGLALKYKIGGCLRNLLIVLQMCDYSLVRLVVSVGALIRIGALRTIGRKCD
jgi:hypothetical protein